MFMQGKTVCDVINYLFKSPWYTSCSWVLDQQAIVKRSQISN
jgi:hypothetical protein